MVGETWDNWKENIRRTIELSPESVTIYQMELPYNTVYSSDILGNKIEVPVADWPTKRDWVDFAFTELGAAGYHINPGNSPILPIMVGDAAKTVALSDALFKRGVLVSAIRPPTVPTGTARLRVTPMATHTQTDLEQAVDAFIAVGQNTGYL